MIKYGELHKALSIYTNEDIPIDYYRRVIRACLRSNTCGLDWGVQQAASILLYLAFNEGRLQPNELTAEGLKTLDFAEKFIEQVQDNNHEKVVDVLLLA